MIFFLKWNVYYICRFLFDESSADFKYYEYQLAQEEKALSQIVESKTSNGSPLSCFSYYNLWKPELVLLWKLCYIWVLVFVVYLWTLGVKLGNFLGLEENKCILK